MADEANPAAPAARVDESSVPAIPLLRKPEGRSGTSPRDGNVGREEVSGGVNPDHGERGGKAGWVGHGTLTGTLRIQQRAADHSELAASIAEAEVSARALLKRLKVAHQKGADNLSSDIRFVDDLITRLGAKRRWVMRKPPKALQEI